MNHLDDFWAAIDAQLLALRDATTADDVLRILPVTPMTSGNGFFAGSGGDDTVEEALRAAGWTVVWYEAHYHYAMRAPNGDVITYVEGDIYRGDQRA